MKLCLAMIAAAALAAASAVGAEPGQPARPPQQPDASPPQLLLASADAAHAQSPATQEAANAPKRPRIGRVTSCRCGDPQPEPQQDQ